MSIKRSLVAIAAAAFASMAFASSALAGGGTVIDTNGTPMGAGEVLHYKGWLKFAGTPGSFECHVTAESKATDDVTGKVTKFTVPDTSKCTGTGVYAGCKLISHSSNEPTITATAKDFDVTGVEIAYTFSGCSMTNTRMTFSNITLQPLKTGTNTVTGTDNKLGDTANPGDPYAGVEFSGSGNSHSEQHIIFVPTTSNNLVTVSGELEITNVALTDRCTWTLKA